jgi:flagellar basal-body rod protein FlgB
MTSINTPPALMRMLSTQMGYTTERQGVLAQNMANVDTPAYSARDLKKLDFSKMASLESKRLEMAITAPQHSGGTLGDKMRIQDEKNRKPFETTPTKNSVVLEEQMAKISDNNAQFQMSSTLLKKYTQLYRTAAGNR